MEKFPKPGGQSMERVEQLKKYPDEVLRVADEVWGEARARASTLHGEGLKTLWDIARNHPAAIRDPEVRECVRALYERAEALEPKPSRPKFSGRSRSGFPRRRRA